MIFHEEFHGHEEIEESVADETHQDKRGVSKYRMQSSRAFYEIVQKYERHANKDQETFDITECQEVEVSSTCW